VAKDELDRTVNLGVGMVALVPPDDVDRALAVLTARHVPAWVAGEVTSGSGEVVLTGSHPA
jgi:phosphoribosylformylglycinamidine cyclo-ligase